jgi:hypothetical protein
MKPFAVFTIRTLCVIHNLVRDNQIVCGEGAPEFACAIAVANEVNSVSSYSL